MTRSAYIGSGLGLLSAMTFAADAGDGGGVPSPAPAPTPAPVKEVLKQNGIKRPDAGSVTGRLWDIADSLSAELKSPAPRKAVVDRYMAEVPNANQATAHTQYARWVTYHGAADALREARELETAQRRQAKEAEAAEAKAKKEADKEATAKAEAEAKAAKAAEREANKRKIEEDRAAKKAEREAEAKRKADEKAAKAKADEKAAKNAKAAA